MGWQILHRWDALVGIAKAAQFALPCIDPNATLPRKTLEDAFARLDATTTEQP